MKEAQQNDPLIAELKLRLESEPGIEIFELKDGILYNCDRNLNKSTSEDKTLKLVVPYSLREFILNLYHNHNLSCVHMAMDKMV